MYATYSQRKRSNPEQQALNERAREEYFTKLRQAPGFVSFTIIRAEDGDNRAVTLWDRPEDAAAFQPEMQRWAQTLDQIAPLVSQGQGEVGRHLTPQTDRQG